MIPIVDAHQHFWRLSRGDYGWLTPELDRLYRDFEPADLAPLLAQAGIAHTVVVQAAPTLAETRFLLELSEATDFVAGVVGWVDLESEDAATELAGLGRHPAFVGVRPMIQDISDPKWMLGDALTPGFEALVERDLAFDALVRPEHLPCLADLLGRHPDLRVVIDHGAKPDIAGGQRETWASDLGRIARETSAACKLSGLATEAASDWTVETLRPYADHLLQTFGPDRLLWGSDWPVIELAGRHRAWWSATAELLAGLSGAERAAVLGGNAIRFYGLEHATTTESP